MFETKVWLDSSDGYLNTMDVHRMMVMMCLVIFSGSSSFHRSPQAEGVPAPHHLPEEPPQVCPDWR